MIRERIEALRKLMAEKGIDAYLIPTADFHESEYVGDYFKCRQYMTGFTGSAGTAVITATEANLWTDGRYFVQAAGELEGSGVILRKMGQDDVPTIEEYLEECLPEGGTLGFDGRVLNAGKAQEYEEKLAHKKIRLAWEEDLVGQLWTDRPALPAAPVWILDQQYAGQTVEEKLAKLREEMGKHHAGVHILTTLDDIVWLLNIRGDDVPCNPVVLSYMVITREKAFLFINPAVLDETVKAYLDKAQITVRPYDSVYEMSGAIRGQKILLEKSRINYAILKSLDESNRIVDEMNPTALAKAVKNPTEIENMKRAHIKDGVIMTKFICWLKKNIGKIPMDEISAGEYLDSMRRSGSGNLGLSFPTISAYGPNAAMCHYSATEKSNKKLEPKGFYLVDSGGQYYEGTTDITRTVAMGPLTEEEREHFTLVAMSMLRLGHVKFLHGCRGLNLDYVAREPLWSRGLNFDHGTGHGVGYLLNVHERPVGIRWKLVPERQDSCVLEDGMVTSDEPGLYLEGRYGIRTENLVYCKKAEKNEFGQFMEFEFLTYAPIDLDAIKPELMEDSDIRYLNEYHRDVYEKISPYLDDEEREWLRESTREIHK